MNDRYLTIIESATSEIKIKKSRFIASAFPSGSLDESNIIISKIKKEFYDASHHPFAFLLFDSGIFRYNDDGEPSGSSGKPIFDAIKKHDLKNIIVIVSRYYGGTKLGIGGLKRAYFQSADECLKKCKKIEVVLTKLFEIVFDYSRIGQVIQYIEKSEFTIKENKSEEIVRLQLEVPISKIAVFTSELTEITAGKVIIKELK